MRSSFYSSQFPQAIPLPPHSAGETQTISEARAAIRGFTLVELIAVVSIALVLLTIAAPNFSMMINNNRLTGQTNDLMATLALARSQASTRKVAIVVCKTSNQSTCNTDNAVHWEDGWIVFVDANRDGSRQNVELLLGSSPALIGSNTVRTDTAFTNYIAFLPDGRSIGSGSTTPPTEGEFRFCDERGAALARVIEVSPVGRAKVADVAGATECP
ncbi:MAG: GspH/FimT family pseudopilin [Thiohalocapsa sp.]